MRLRIHRGAREIGGSCVEVESGGRRLLLDLGLPLAGEAHLPDVPGLTKADEGLLGVVLSHAHLDHYGLLPQAREDLTVWLGAAADRLLKAASPFMPSAAIPQTVSPYRDRRPFEIGPFRITPYLMDHSAFDAYALLVEAGGKSLLYSGDFRGHGRKARVFERFLADPPADIDVLLMEGTTVSREGASLSETEVEDEAARLMTSHPGIVLTAFSGQNIDRFVSLLRATQRAGRTFVADVYMAALVRAAAMRGLPDLRSHPSVRIFLPRSQRRAILKARAFELVEPYRGQRIFSDELAADPSRFTLMFRASMIGDLKGIDLAGGALIYSLWPGYLDRDRVDLRGFAAERGLAFHVVHGSGHAEVADLRRMAQSVAPRRLIPIHTDNPLAYERLFTSAEPLEDGRWTSV